MQPSSNLGVSRLSPGHVCLTAPPVAPAPALWRCRDPPRRCGLSSPSSRRAAPFQSGRQQHVGRSRQAVRSDASLMQQAVTSSSEALGWLHSLPALQDTCATVTAVLGAAALIKAFDALTQAGWLDQKLSRKLVHMLAGPGFALCWPLFSLEPHARLCAALVPSLNVVRLLLLGFGIVKDEGTVKSMSRSGDRRELLRGPLYYVLVLIAATLVFWRDSPVRRPMPFASDEVGLVAISLMCGGDGLADIVGRRWGSSARLPWNPAKSWPGSAAMFLGGTAMALGSMAFFSAWGFFECDPMAAAGSVATIAAAATLMESLPLNRWLDDNISVPGTAALLGTLLADALVLA